MLLPMQCQMARAALGWGVRDLAAAAKVGVDTVTRFERGETLMERTVDAIRRAFEDAGIDFIPENGGGPGVRLRKPITPAAPKKVLAPMTATETIPRKKRRDPQS
jgi:transcriptional regulator with XRE-family HTH domain